MNFSIFFRKFCVTPVIFHVFLSIFARENWCAAAKNAPICACPTFDRCVPRLRLAATATAHVRNRSPLGRLPQAILDMTRTAYWEKFSIAPIFIWSSKDKHLRVPPWVGDVLLWSHVVSYLHLIFSLLNVMHVDSHLHLIFSLLNVITWKRSFSSLSTLRDSLTVQSPDSLSRKTENRQLIFKLISPFGLFFPLKISDQPT